MKHDFIKRWKELVSCKHNYHYLADESGVNWGTRAKNSHDFITSEAGRSFKTCTMTQRKYILSSRKKCTMDARINLLNDDIKNESCSIWINHYPWTIRFQAQMKALRPNIEKHHNQNAKVPYIWRKCALFSKQNTSEWMNTRMRCPYNYYKNSKRKF